MEGQRKAGERGFNLASLNLDAEPAPKKEPQKKGDYSFATSLLQKVAAGTPVPEIKKGAELKWDGTKFVLQVNGKPAPITEPIKPKTPPTPEAPNSRDAEPPTKNPNNIEQKGTIMGGASPMTMKFVNETMLQRGGLAGKDYKIQNPFASTQLPATSASNYFQKNPDVSYSRDLPEDMFSDVNLKLASNVFDARSGVEFGKNLPQFPASGKIEYEQKAGAPLTVSSGTFKVTEANESAQQPEVNVDMARRRAFLDGDLNSMEALRAIEAQKGIVVTGNTYNIVNPNAGQEGESDFKQIDKAQRDIIMRGGDAAQELKDQYVKGIVESTKKAEDEKDNK